MGSPLGPALASDSRLSDNKYFARGMHGARSLARVCPQAVNESCPHCGTRLRGDPSSERNLRPKGGDSVLGKVTPRFRFLGSSTNQESEHTMIVSC